MKAFDLLTATELADVWEALYCAREDARERRQMFKAARHDRMILALYDAPAWDNRAFLEPEATERQES